MGVEAELNEPMPEDFYKALLETSVNSKLHDAIDIA